MTKQKPRGIRNNNPGNIRISKDPWQGLAKSQPDRAFFTFESAKWGIRALARVLITYQDKHKLTELRQIIRRWAPPVENNTDAYVEAVSKATGFKAHDTLDLHRFDHIEPLLKAIIKHENGQQPYDQATINEGLKLAGVTLGKKAIVTKDPETKGTVLTASGAGGLTIADDLQRMLQPLIPHSEYIKYLFLAVALVGIAITLRARWKKA